jgi:hypothetical protein
VVEHDAPEQARRAAVARADSVTLTRTSTGRWVAITDKGDLVGLVYPAAEAGGTYRVTDHLGRPLGAVVGTLLEAETRMLGGWDRWPIREVYAAGSAEPDGRAPAIRPIEPSLSYREQDFTMTGHGQAQGGAERKGAAARKARARAARARLKGAR